MVNYCHSTVQQKLKIIIHAIRVIRPVLIEDYSQFEALEALQDALIIMGNYPHIEDLKRYPLGLPGEDKNALAVLQNIGICLSGNAPAGTLQMIYEHLLQASENLHRKLEEI